MESLRKDIEILSQNHERDVDRKDAIIQMLDRDLEEVSEFFAHIPETPPPPKNKNGRCIFVALAGPDTGPTVRSFCLGACLSVRSVGNPSTPISCEYFVDLEPSHELSRPEGFTAGQG